MLNAQFAHQVVKFFRAQRFFVKNCQNLHLFDIAFNSVIFISHRSASWVGERGHCRGSGLLYRVSAMSYILTDIKTDRTLPNKLLEENNCVREDLLVVHSCECLPCSY